jgi:hypothetical protein
VRALDALALVSGNVGVRGRRRRLHRHAPAAPSTTRSCAGAAVAPRTLPEPLLGASILAAKEPPIRAIWVTAGNPVTMLPDSATVRRAFERSEFNVVVDTHPTDTTDVADLVLPCLTLLEDDDVLGSYGNHWLRVSRPAVAPRGEARHEIAILRGLAERLGLADRFPASVDDWKRRLLARLAPHGITSSRSRRRRPATRSCRRCCSKDAASRRRRQGAAARRSARPPPSRATPTTRSPASPARRRRRSRRSGPSRRRRTAELRVHPDAAAGCADGAIARLESRIGALAVRVRHDASVQPDLACMAKGGMLRDGRCANLLVARGHDRRRRRGAPTTTSRSGSSARPSAGSSFSAVRRRGSSRGAVGTRRATRRARRRPRDSASARRSQLLDRDEQRCERTRCGPCLLQQRDGVAVHPAEERLVAGERARRQLGAHDRAVAEAQRLRRRDVDPREVAQRVLERQDVLGAERLELRRLGELEAARLGARELREVAAGAERSRRGRARSSGRRCRRADATRSCTSGHA